MIRLMVPALLFASTAAAATITVDVSSDSSATEHQKCTSADNDCTLRAAVAKASAGDTIDIQATRTCVLDSTLVINKSVNIKSVGISIIKTTKPIQMISLKKPTSGVLKVSFNAIVFTGADASVFGGAIASSSDAEVELTIDSCFFENNSAKAGGALYFASVGTLDIVRSVFANNSAALGAGAALIAEGKIKARISHSTFRDNVANDGDGGALLSHAMSTIVEHTSFFRNAASTGGAVSVRAQPDTFLPTLRLSFVTVARNDALAFGGIVSEEPAVLEVVNSLLGENVGGDCGGKIKSLGFNLIEQPGGCELKAAGDLSGKPSLLRASEEGGSSQLMPVTGFVPRCQSAAVDNACKSPNGSFECTSTLDALDFDRPAGNGRDIGAVEAPVLSASATVEAPLSVTEGATFDYVITVTNGSPRHLRGTTYEVVIPSAFTVSAKPERCVGTSTFTCTADTIKASVPATFAFKLSATTAGAAQITATPTTDSCLTTPLTTEVRTIEVFAEPTPPQEEEAIAPVIEAPNEPVAAQDAPPEPAVIAQEEESEPLATVDELFVRRAQQPAAQGCSASGDHTALLWLGIIAFFLARRSVSRVKVQIF